MSKDGQIPLLDMLSKSLQDELQFQKHMECFQNSRFLGTLSWDGDYNVYQFLCDVIRCCLRNAILARDDVAFGAGTVATACCYIADGECRYETASMCLGLGH